MKNDKITSIEGERKKQLIKIGLIIAAVFTIIFLLVKFTDNKKSLPVKEKDELLEKKDKTKFSGASIETEKDVWIARSEEKLKTLEEENRVINQQLKTLTDILDRNMTGHQEDIFPEVKQGDYVGNNIPITPLPQAKPAVPLITEPQVKIIPPSGIKKFSFGTGIKLPVKTESTIPVSPLKSKESEETPKEEEISGKNKENWLPSGSFMAGILLSGLDAPTGGQAQTNPHPVLIKITDNAILPNRFRTKIKECFVTAGGYGDISSERAYIRTETLSCVMKDGRIIDTPLKGYIAGEDGKNGMRGRLVSKEGQLLARGMMAGFASGVSDAFKSSASTFSISPLGAVQTVEPDKMLEAGAYSGAGKAMERLANYYISMAEKVFPIIEVDSGRKIDVVLLKGLSLEVI